MRIIIIGHQMHYSEALAQRLSSLMMADRLATSTAALSISIRQVEIESLLFQLPDSAILDLPRRPEPPTHEEIREIFTLDKMIESIYVDETARAPKLNHFNEKMNARRMKAKFDQMKLRVKQQASRY